MNHQYKLVWNQAKKCWQAVTEFARGHCQSTKSQTPVNGASHHSLAYFSLKPIFVGVTAALFATQAYAEPTGGQVTAGVGTISQQGAITTINQSTQNMAIDWHTFNIGAHEAVNFNQPNASAIALNRVTGTESSSILGSLTANGQVFILNPNGVLIGAGAQVNVGGFVASTLNLSNDDFLKGNFNFNGSGSGSVTNLGNITVPQGGTVAFLAPIIKNSGNISATQGNVLLAAADNVTLTMLDGNLVSYTLNKGSVQTLIDNGGLIQADGGHVVLTAKGVDALSKSAINHTGIIEAQTVSSREGKVELLGDMQIGDLNVSGKLDASAPTNDNGGFVETSAANVKVASSAQINTGSTYGKAGTWLIDPLDITINASIASAINNALLSGNVTISTSGNNNPSTASGQTNGNGDIFVNNEIKWSSNSLFTLNADRNIQVNANISGEGTSSGLALNTASGDYFLNNGSKINLIGSGATFSADGTSYTVIQNINQLQAVNNNLTGKYVLGKDVDASQTLTWNSGKGFNPIGVGNDGFQGIFDGFNHVIKNIYINRPTEQGVGLFHGVGKLAVTSFSSRVQNLGLNNFKITGREFTGGFAGFNSGTLFRTYAEGVLNGYSHVGGLVGLNHGIIEQSHSSASVTGTDNYVGGLVGDNATIAVNATINPLFSTGGYIIDSYATGDVIGTVYTGGLVGYNFGGILRSYSVGTVSGITVGGLVDYSDPSYSFNDARFPSTSPIFSYWDTQASGVSDSFGGGTGLTTAQMQTPSTYTGWDNSVWILSQGNYPKLRNMPSLSVTSISNDEASIVICQNNPAACARNPTISDSIEPEEKPVILGTTISTDPLLLQKFNKLTDDLDNPFISTSAILQTFLEISSNTNELQDILNMLSTTQRASLGKIIEIADAEIKSIEKLGSLNRMEQGVLVRWQVLSSELKEAVASKTPLGKSADVLGNIGTVLQVIETAKMVVESYKESGSPSSGYYSDIATNAFDYLSLLPGPYTKVAVATVKLPVAINELFIGSLGDGLKNQANSVVETMESFNRSNLIVASDLANNKITEVEAQARFKKNKENCIEIISSVNSEFQKPLVVGALLVSGNGKKLEKVVSAIEESIDALNTFTFSDVQSLSKQILLASF